MAESKVQDAQKAPNTDSIDPEIEEMFRAGLYFGYSSTRRHPKMKPYIFGIRNNVEVFDLEKVREKLNEAEDFLKNLARDGGTVLFVGSKPSAAPLIEKTGAELNMPYSARRWPGGLLTNFEILRKRIDYLEDLKMKKASGELAKYTKKEQLDLSNEIEKLEQKFAGLLLLKKTPDALVIVDPKEEKTATREALKMGIKIVGIMNIDNDPDLVTHPIPANDSANSSIKYILQRLVTAYKAGLETGSVNLGANLVEKEKDKKEIVEKESAEKILDKESKTAETKNG